MRIAAVQMQVVPGNVRRNLAEMLGRIAEAKAQAADVVVFPELATCGYLLGDRFEDEAFIEEIARANEKLREASDGIAVVFGSIIRDRTKRNEDGRLRKYNAACIVQNGLWIANPVSAGFVPKTNLPKYRIFDDARHFTPSAKLAAEKGLTVQGFLKPFEIRLQSGRTVRLGITICEDLWEEDYPIKPSIIYRLAGAEFILNISCSPWTAGKRRARENMLKNRANETGLPILYVATAGLQNNAKDLVWFDGGSAYVDGRHRFCWRAEDNSASLAILDTVDLARKPVAGFRPKSEIEEIHGALIGAIREFLAPFKKVVIGLSGGIDSAVVAALAVEALGKEKVLGINMPTRFNSETTRALAAQLAENLRIEYRVVSIEGLFAESVKTVGMTGYGDLFARARTEPQVQLALENEQARIRGAGVLALIAQLEGGVFAATGNKTEIALNYFTLYGDGAGAAAFLGDLWKGQVYELAEFLNERSGRRIIPTRILLLRPSAELSADQDVEAGKGDPIYYPYHDKLLRAFLEKRVDPEWVLQRLLAGTLEEDLGCPEGTLGRFEKFLGDSSREAFIRNLEWAWRQFCTSFKHVQTPPVFLASRRAYGFDYREFIGEAYFTEGYEALKQKYLSVE